MLVPSIVSVICITLFVCYVRLKRRHEFSEKSSWKIVDSSFEEWPKRPSELPSPKNEAGIYIDRIPIIEDTKVSYVDNVCSFETIAGESIRSLPLYTTAHSNEEHFLTTIHISFHLEADKIFMDILSLDKDFLLRSNNQFSLQFTNGTQWDFVFPQSSNDEYAASVPLTLEQLRYISVNALDKWRMRRDKDDYFTVGALNFEIRKYIYKPEIQATIQTMAKRMLQAY
ncbi:MULTISPECIES: hypothetical protein [Chitinophagaceae]